ncbi:RING finger protein [Cryptosporidium canis]|uniref:E3 ubiquitin-protein ligase CHFR n=1 Tax=Cryptosporidium canis TaxID=195482 RepID=A0ABQ8P7B1_9CRYT|nr:RING finger protein [Cryptosporidium canis]KAJ1614397.1 RING finger protein [Cryptosporidium canis]
MINQIIKSQAANERKHNCEHKSNTADHSSNTTGVTITTESFEILEKDILMKNKSRKVGITTNSGYESRNITNKILSEFTCPVCLDYYILPVTIPCGHTFCRYCITHNRLLGKNCPICRQQIGYNFRINMAIHNVIVSLGILKQLENPPYDEMNYDEILYVYKELIGQNRPKWWQLCFCKPVISVTLFSRIISDEILGIGIVFAEDLTRCIIDRLSKLSSTLHDNKLRNIIWSNGIYMIGPLEINLLAKWMGCPPLPFNLDRNEIDDLEQNSDFTLNNNVAFKSQVKRWVEECIALKPTILNIGQNPFMKANTHPIIRILSDRIHRVESKIYDLGILRSPLPWDLGRHSKSTIQISHSSVSTNHLLIVNIKEHDQASRELMCINNCSDSPEESSSLGKDWGIGIIDLGSSIGTMLKIQSKHRLAMDEIIHLADRVEIIVKIRTVDEILNENNHLHNDNELLINQWKKLRWSNRLNLVVNIDEYSKDDNKSLGEDNNMNVDISTECCVNEECIEQPKSLDENKIVQIPLDDLELEEIKECLEVYIPVGSNVSPPCEGAKKTENGIYWSVIVHPSGMVFGRGKNGALGLRKVEVTESNGYISREHCIFYYSSIKNSESNGADNLYRSKECLSNWYVKDVSTSGTFLRLKPFNYPVRILPGMVLKVGQCKMEILPYMIGSLLSGQSIGNPRNHTINVISQDIQEPQHLLESELLQNYITNISQTAVPYVGNGAFYTQPSNSPYLFNMDNNLIAQMNVLAAYNYINASAINNLVSSNNIIDLNSQLADRGINQGQNIHFGQANNVERSHFDQIILQNILSNSIMNSRMLSVGNYLENVQNEEDSSILGSSINPLEVGMLSFERRPREPRVTQEGDVLFQIESYENSNDC